jgi:hypothetical protein
MEVEDYFIIALILAVVAFLSFLMRSNPFGTSDSFPLGYIKNYLGLKTDEIEMYNTALNVFIFLPSAYFAVAFSIGGTVKTFVRKITKK